MTGYFNDKDPIDNVPLNWSAHPSGLPIRNGDAPNLIDKKLLEYASHVVFARSEVFEIPRDLDKYTKIMDWISKLAIVGGASIRTEEKTPDPAKPGTWHVWLVWVELRGTIPTNSPRMQ